MEPATQIVLREREVVGVLDIGTHLSAYVT